MLQTMGNNMDPAMSRMILADIARLRKMPALAKRIEEYAPEPDPMQEQMQQLEMQKLQWEIEKLKSETQENYADAQQKGAKAHNITADTDKKTLDFVEQESGVTQERELQRIGEQARSQGQLKMVDHQLKEDEKRKDLLRSYVESSANA